MKRFHQIAALLFMAVAAYITYGSFELQIYGANTLGPGPGFFPFCVGVLSLMLSFVWFIQISRSPARQSEQELPLFEKEGSKRILLIIALFISVIIFLKYLGFSLTMFVFILVILLRLGRPNWLLTLAICFVGSYGVFYLFKALNVPLPIFKLF